MAVHQQFFNTDIAHRGMGEFSGRGVSKSKTLPRDSPHNEIIERMRGHANEVGVTAVTATQTTRVSDRRPGAWYFRVFRGVEYEELLHKIQQNEHAGFESQRNIILMRCVKQPS